MVEVGEQISCENIFSASQMNKAVIVLVTEETLKYLIEHRIWVSRSLLISLLVSPTRIMIFNVPLFMPNANIKCELPHFRKFVSSVKLVALNCKTLH